ncbi:MAG: hypothetical protein EA343_24140 [Nodularia sp. (in: Bacteria)]|nr:MAG: hypothetical protein EA343_24140 [Nodularia sp. (in: cyanobacteria)]
MSSWVINLLDKIVILNDAGRKIYSLPVVLFFICWIFPEIYLSFDVINFKQSHSIVGRKAAKKILYS